MHENPRERNFLSGVDQEYTSVLIISNSLLLLPGQTNSAVEEMSEISEWPVHVPYFLAWPSGQFMDIHPMICITYTCIVCPFCR